MLTDQPAIQSICLLNRHIEWRVTCCN